MNRLGLVFLGCCLLALVLPAVAGAENPHTRGGFILGLNAGGGSAGLTFEDLNGESSNSDREGGGAFNIRAAWAFNPQFAAGLEMNSWTKDEGGSTVTFDVTAAAATFYPGANGLFLRGGVGAGTVDVEFTDDTGTTVSASKSGLGLFGGVGYEWRLGRRWALGPMADFGWMSIDDVDGGKLKVNYFNFTVGFDWYF